MNILIVYTLYIGSCPGNKFLLKHHGSGLPAGKRRDEELVFVGVFKVVADGFNGREAEGAEGSGLDIRQ